MIHRLSAPPFDGLDALFTRRSASDPATREAVSAILDAVRERGDEAVREYSLQFDGVDLAPSAWSLDSGLWQAALQRLDPALRAALGRAVDRVRAYHEHLDDATGSGIASVTSASRCETEKVPKPTRVTRLPFFKALVTESMMVLNGASGGGLAYAVGGIRDLLDQIPSLFIPPLLAR